MGRRIRQLRPSSQLFTFVVRISCDPSGRVSGIVERVKTGVLLDVTPTVLQNGLIRMDVNVQDSQFVPTSGNSVVEVDKNNAATTMQVASGETIIIGGLVLNRRSTSSAGLPWLRHIPLVNLAIARYERTQTKHEVMIFVTLHFWTPGMTPPLVAPEAFTIQEPKDKLTPLERFEW